MRGREQKISEDNCPREGRAELENNVGVQTFIWINETENTEGRLLQKHRALKLENRRIPNGMYGGVRGWLLN